MHSLNTGSLSLLSVPTVCYTLCLLYGSLITRKNLIKVYSYVEEMCREEGQQLWTTSL